MTEAPQERARQRVRAVHHFSVQSHDPDEIGRFLEELIGLPRTHRVNVSRDVATTSLRWPAGDGGTSATIFGSGSGAVEVIAIPPELRGAVTSGPVQPCFAVRDLVRLAGDCRARGLVVSDAVGVEDGEVRALTCTVRAGGVDFEIVQFEQPSRTTPQTRPADDRPWIDHGAGISCGT